MKNNILSLIKEAASKAYDRDLTKIAEGIGKTMGEGDGEVSREALVKHMREAEDYVYSLFTKSNLEGERFNTPSIPFSEMQVSSDSSVVFKRVISELLLKPKEPNAWLTNNVARKITLDAQAPLTVTFPVVGAFQAFEVAEGGEYRPQALTFQENVTSLRLKKFGVLASLSEEIINASIYPLIATSLELMANGINRRVEEMCFSILTQKSQVVFDNDLTLLAYDTTGVDVNQVFNGSMALADILTLAGVVVGNRYEPDSLLIHPLAYPVIFQDPLIRATFFHQGQMGGSIWSQKPGFDQSVNMPFGLSYVPYYALPYTEGGVMATAPGSGFAPALLTDVYVIDSNNAMVLLQRGDIEMDDFDDWFHDAKVMKAKKYVNGSAMDAGRGMAVARNVRVVRNYEPITTIRNTV